MKAFLGMGLLGSNFVKAMIRKGNQVQVWNRTPAKASALEAAGAKAYPTPEEAVRNADIVHLALKDDHTVDEVLAMAAAGLKRGAIIVDHTTTSAAGAVKRTQEWKARGFTYQHAPVFMGPQNALESTGFMLVSGDQAVIRQLEPELAAMTGKVINFGEETGKAAGMKLIGNLFLVGMTAGLADALSLAKALNIPVDDLTTLFGSWNPGAVLLGRLQRMSSGNYDQPSWELAMARKDTQLFMDAAAAGGSDLAVIPAIAAEMDKWIANGHGNKDWTVIGSGK
ncbi:NAD(P)-dependent oxidoreductase [uncultured Chitinophaga sp.]|jgi:3-hydroxyisobutyrate dehydrogenase and related beta-hydroxyacid dehydrogenases|uniref:NAD(P)-dependent oxidoreductase n=1 Tax=uncultured Chitinophaga sp. TaxID=339340 RepID=UPI00260FA888|nr:NAD(P)-dependent oxidoreductase [uncultured Chitinophaga sp.]